MTDNKLTTADSDAAKASISNSRPINGKVFYTPSDAQAIMDRHNAIFKNGKDERYVVRDDIAISDNAGRKLRHEVIFTNILGAL
jgi:endo-beta-N-acetylglucosaminidase D